MEGEEAEESELEGGSAVEIGMVLVDEEIREENNVGEASEIHALPSMVVLEEEEEPQSRRMDMAGEKAMAELKKQKKKRRKKKEKKKKV